MSYENPKIPEGINVTDEHPLKDFFAMLVGVGLVAITVILTLILVSDGDTLPGKEAPVLSAAFGSFLILGVGNSYRGKFIDGHSSRQDAHSLRRLALRLGGLYHDANARHVPTAELQKLDSGLPLTDRGAVELRDLAIWAVLAGAFVTAAVPLALALLGAAWNAARLRHGLRFWKSWEKAKVWRRWMSPACAIWWA